MNFPPDIAPDQGNQARQEKYGIEKDGIEKDGITLDSAAARILESITDAFFALDTEWRFTYLNAQAERLLGRTQAELLGRNVWAQFPAAVDAAFYREYHRAVADRVTVTFEEYYPPPLDTWFEVRAYPSDDGLSVFFQSANDRKRAEQALRRSQEDLQLAVDGARLGTFYCDYPLDKITWNPTCKEHFFLPPDAEVDFTLFYSLLHPDDREPTRLAIERALAERALYDVEYRTLAPDGRTQWVNAVGRFYYDANGNPTRFDGITIDISARKAAEEELRAQAERERFLADLAERARRLTDPDAVIADAVRSVGQFLGVDRCVFADIDIAADTCTVPPDYLADETVASMAGTFPISAFGPFLVSEYGAGRTVVADDVRQDPRRFPADYVGAYRAVGIRAFVAVPVLHSSRLVSVLAAHSATPRRWKAEEVELLRNVVERTWLTVEVTRQEHALAREAETTTRLLESITDAFFTLDHEYRFTYVNGETERVLFKSCYDLLGRYIWAVFPEGEGSMFDQQYRRAVADSVSVSFEEFYPPLDAWLEVRAYPSDDGISVFFQNVTERKRAEAERERLLAEQQARAETESLLNRIGQALRGSPDPETVLETAVRELGQALGADRCYYAAYDQEADAATVGPDWHCEGLPTLVGQYPMSRFAVNGDPVYKAGRTQIVADTAGDPATQALGLRALVRVPLVSGTAMTALSAAMADGPRQWTPEEVSLVEAVATQTQTALEAVQVRQREHAIAQQLQDALQPAVPEHVPRLSVGKFTRPALNEAQVGGDFYDVFPLDKNLYAIVIGDVSGKGLAAAQQLALIRNSLRTTLYLYRNPAEAVTNLNAIVSAHELLVGFVTAWVGVYDTATGQITYASCGHEPGLIRRVSGEVEELETTGPPLGVAQNAHYSELMATLGAGDVLLLYTDGISEAGPNRRELLATTGLKQILAGLPENTDAQVQAEMLVTEVSGFAGGVFRDDVAVLLAMRQ